MELPTELRLEIYKYLLTVEHGATHTMISMANVKDCLVRLLQQTLEELLEYGLSEIEPLLHVNILRVCSFIYHEAKSIMYEQNTFSIDPEELPSNAPFHHHFPIGWELSSIRRIRLELSYCSCPDLPQVSRSYGIWSSFLLLPALREVELLIHV